jgi:alkylhydroperoxidase family enzyme
LDGCGAAEHEAVDRRGDIPYPGGSTQGASQVTRDPGAERPAWIEVIPEADARDELKELYDELRSKVTGRVDHVMMVHSLHPRSMRDHEQLYRTIMYGPGGLSRPERETIGVVVSALNRCHY